VRRHLAILAADGRVQVLGERERLGPGRPVHVYGLADAGQGPHLAGLADALLAQILENTPKEDQDALWQALALRLLAGQQSAAGGVANITRRLAASVELLNRLGYAARWEAHAAGPRIIFEQCPYRLLLEKHPGLCRMDASLLAESLGREVEQVARLEKNARGTTFCMFAV
jgi:predicted ArsR family transcriptional regulator